MTSWLGDGGGEEFGLLLVEDNTIVNEVHTVRIFILLIKILVLFLARSIFFNLELLCLFLRQICLKYNRTLFIKCFSKGADTAEELGV